MAKYSIVIERVEQVDEMVVSSFGSLKLISAAAKEGLAEIKGRDGDFLATVIEENGDGREVVRVRATADIVTLVVNKRLKDEKANEAQAGAPVDPEGSAADSL